MACSLQYGSFGPKNSNPEAIDSKALRTLKLGCYDGLIRILMSGTVVYSTWQSFPNLPQMSNYRVIAAFKDLILF
jgi:hypothetical protein